MATLAMPGDPVSELVFAPGGRSLVTVTEGQGAANMTAWRWEIEGRQPRARLEGYDGAFYQVAFTADGRRVAAGCEDQAARIWDAATGRLQVVLRGTGGQTGARAVTPDGRRLVTAAYDGGARLWDLESGRLLSTQAPGGYVHAVALSPDGRLLATANQPGPGACQVRIWTMEPGGPVLRAGPVDLKELVLSFAFSPDGKVLAAGGVEAVRLFDAGTGRELGVRPGRWHLGAGIVFAPDGRRLAIGTGDGRVQLCEVPGLSPVATFAGFDDWVPALAFSPDGKILAAASSVNPSESGVAMRTGGVKLWDTATGKLKAVLPLGTDERTPAVAFSPDGRLLATATGIVGSQAEMKLAPARGPGRVRLWDVATGRLRTTLTGLSQPATAVAFAPEGTRVAGQDGTGRVILWELPGGKALPAAPAARLLVFGPNFARPVSGLGAAVRLHAPQDGRLLATLVPLGADALDPPAASPAAPAGSLQPARPAERVATGEWFVATPEGYFDCSANAARLVRWNVNGRLYPAERYLRRFRRPDLVRRALQGERLDVPALGTGDVPPAARILGLHDGDPVPPGDTLTVTVAATDDRRVGEVDLLVNGRPLPPENARPIEVLSRPIEVLSRPASPGRSPSPPADPQHRIEQRFTYRFAPPQGAAEIHLRAIAYDETGLGSDPVDLVLRHAGAVPAAGNLYVLAVGVSRYRNGRAERGEGQFANLRYAADDARAVAARFAREGKPLYERVEIRTLLDEEATATNVRAELQRLRQVVRPGQVDTVVIFLSGHGVGQDGKYYFATHDLDLKDLPRTSLPAPELREALGGALRAKAVFLFVDTCHSGGLGGRSDDLALAIGQGVYVMASSSAEEYAYESPAWGHGAFTLALLRALDRRDLEDEGAIRFVDLARFVAREVRSLMRAAGRSETEQEPCIPLDRGRLLAPVAQAPR
jgi:WD40 repeat protein